MIKQNVVPYFDHDKRTYRKSQTLIYQEKQIWSKVRNFLENLVINLGDFLHFILQFRLAAGPQEEIYVTAIAYNI